MKKYKQLIADADAATGHGVGGLFAMTYALKEALAGEQFNADNYSDELNDDSFEVMRAKAAMMGFDFSDDADDYDVEEAVGGADELEEVTGRKAAWDVDDMVREDDYDNDAPPLSRQQ